jgi:large subunit ribosomal protein L15
MTSVLSRLSPPPGAKKVAKRLGRGIGTGLGKTAGRGQKGQKARSTGNIGKKHFQGGQTPIQRRLPKRGFRNPFAVEMVIVNVGTLDTFEAGTNVDETALRDRRLVQGRDVMVKVLGNGELTKALTVTAHKFSASAVAKIEAAGGKVIVIAAEEQSA